MAYHPGIQFAVRSLLSLSLWFSAAQLKGQGCCSGGSGSPIAGNSAQGVLGPGQIELATSFQYLHSNKFLTGDHESDAIFKSFDSRYLYSRVALGITKEFTLSLENGYFLNKTQTELEGNGKIQSSGPGDLIIFPRYDVFNRKTLRSHNEITVGLGYKIPLGSHSDSHVVYTNPATGRQYFTISPPLVQPTTGSQDVIFYLFGLHSGAPGGLRCFANFMYIRKGWNSLGEKFGDFTGVNLFVSKSFFHKLGLTLQLNAETIRPLEYHKNIDLLALYNVDVNSTGSKKLSLIPQVSYSYRSLTFYVLGEVPLYQNVRGTQVALQRHITAGISYRFFTNSVPKSSDSTATSLYECSMHCPGGGSDKPGTCRVCGMDLEKQDVKK